jgi:predicted transposase/invertase (TIGR01784 family)
MTLSVKEDLLFKRCFANAAHPEVTERFIEDVLGFEVSDIRIENPYFIEEFENKSGDPDLRHTVVDVIVRLKDRRLITAELQRRPQQHFLQRSAFYLASQYIQDYDRKEFRQSVRVDGSEKFSTLYPIYGISILDFDLFKQDSRALRHFTFTDLDTSELLTPDGMLHLCYLELRKNPPEHLKHWVDFFNDLPAANDAPDYIKQAYTLVDYANLDEKERKMLDKRDLWEQDQIGQMNYAKNEARIEGKAEVINSLIANGNSVDDVVKLTGFSSTEINSLLHQRC